MILVSNPMLFLKKVKKMSRFIDVIILNFIAFYGLHELFFKESIFNTILSIVYLLSSLILILYLIYIKKERLKFVFPKFFVNYVMAIVFFQMYFGYKNNFELYELVLMIIIAVLTSIYIIFGLDLNGKKD